MALNESISIEKLAHGLARNFPDFEAMVSCERLSGGANQETYRLVARCRGGVRTFALRRALGGGSGGVLPGYAGLRAEAILMRAAAAVGVPEPEVCWIFGPDDGLGDGFLMQWLDGETLGKRIVEGDALAEIRPQLAYQCGQILARIHAIDAESAGLDGVLRCLPPGEYLEQTYARYCSFDISQPMIDFAARWLRERVRDDVPMRVVHNDFRNGNLMISNEGVIAVLDWELAHIGDPMRDLGWLCTNSWRFGRSELPVGGFGAYEDLFRGYESVAGHPVDQARVRYWEVFGSFWWAIGCLEMANAFRTGLDRSVERAAIGRRTSECQIDLVNLLIPGAIDLLAPVPEASADMPRTDELLRAVADFLRGEVMAATAGRTRFLARVAANAVEIAARDASLGNLHRARMAARLAELLGASGDLREMLRRLVTRLRDGSMPLDHPGLAAFLRDSVATQVAIDQPGYSGLRVALEKSAAATAD